MVSLSMTIGARNITFDDLYSVPGYDDIQISPDGMQIIFVLTTRDVTANETASHIWIMDPDGVNKHRLTSDTISEGDPRWSPDGKSIYYLSDKETETDQVWRIGADGGETHQVTNMSTGVSGFEIFPDGTRLIIRSRVYPDCHSDSCNQARQEEEDNKPVKARKFDKLLYRHYIRWDDGKVNRLFIYNLDQGTYNEVYGGPHDTPSSLLGGYGGYSVAPEGDEVCFVMHTDSIPATWPNNDLFIISLNGGDTIRITDNEGLDTSPQYSPDGRYVAYHSMARAGYESDQRDLVLYDRSQKAHTNLTLEFDRSIGGFSWGPKSHYIYFSAIEHGFSKIWRLDIESGKIEILLGDGVYSDFTLFPNGESWIVSHSLSDKPYELYRMNREKDGWLQLTDFAKKVVSDIEMKQARDFWFIGAQGDSVHGFLTLPPDFDGARKYPLVLLIHGGPQWCWLGDFNYYGWNTQLMAAQGYVVAQIDPHGSIGYGLKFKEYVSGNWGRGDYEDLMLGIDYLINSREHHYIDSTRMAALGRSYGGFMVNWICGHTDRFQCLISIDGTYNHISGYGSTEELWFPEWEFKGTPWSNYDEYVRSSPVTYAGNFKTPTMVIHGQRDYRVDISEGLQMFTALQRMGVPSQLLYFPDEGHSVRKLKNLRYVYERQLEWLKQWLGE
jgi:dipeptidyl aminopeptidase/acylaminoacyl peptidase